jgi:sulfate adenylyltransferase subunit 2
MNLLATPVLSTPVNCTAWHELSAPTSLSNLDRLESQAAHILLETVAELNPTALMFSGGKDSICLAHIISKVFRGGASLGVIPFDYVHYDSGDNFTEVLEFRDHLAKVQGAHLKVLNVVDYSRAGLLSSPLDGVGNVKALSELVNLSQRTFGYAGLIGGGRRDEDAVRAKERIFSVRDKTGKWDPESQRPEFWNNYNTSLPDGGHIRVFPISNWTERNVWEYITRERIELPSIYYAHERQVVQRDGKLLAYFDDLELRPGEQIETRSVRCRTVGDRKTTGFIESFAKTNSDILSELLESRYSERAGRMEDRAADTGMESRKQMVGFKFTEYRDESYSIKNTKSSRG